MCNPTWLSIISGLAFTALDIVPLTLEASGKGYLPAQETRERGFDPGSGRKKWQPNPVLLSGDSHRPRA